jgi:fucose 4-O-acetylase-like acetyltransferase
MRISWIDNMRWIGILLIVLGHTLMPEWSLLTTYIFSFHVVLFFILSGLLFRVKENENIIKFVKTKFMRLMVPFICFNILFFIIMKLEWKFTGTRVVDFLVWLGYWDYLGDNWWYMNNTGWFNLINISTWFLPALFLTSIYYFILNHFVKNIYIRVSILIILSVIVFIESRATIFRFPWSAEIALMMTLFYWVAHSFKSQIFQLIESIRLKHLSLIPIILFLHFITLNSVNVSTNYYGNYWLFILNSVLGFITFLIIAKNIWDNRVLNFFWKNSIIILWFEWIRVEIMENINFLSFWLLQYERGYIEWFTQFTLTILFLIPIIWIINKYIPFILGWGYKKSS